MGRYLVGICVKCLNSKILRELHYINGEMVSTYGWRNLEFSELKKKLNELSNNYPDAVIFREDSSRYLGELNLTFWQSKGVRFGVWCDDIHSLKDLNEHLIVNSVFRIDVYIGTLQFN